MYDTTSAIRRDRFYTERRMVALCAIAGSQWKNSRFLETCLTNLGSYVPLLRRFSSHWQVVKISYSIFLNQLAYTLVYIFFRGCKNLFTINFSVLHLLESQWLHMWMNLIKIYQFCLIRYVIEFPCMEINMGLLYFFKSCASKCDQSYYTIAIISEWFLNFFLIPNS